MPRPVEADDVLRVDGQIDFSNYEGLQPVYTEYNIGHYRRSFSLPNQIDEYKISAQMNDGDSAVLACLKQHRAQLSKACEKVLTENTP